MRKKNYTKTTVNDIAKHAGVAQSTVSKVLNNYPHVNKDTKRRVLDAIEELHFRPDPIARSLVTNRSNTIGLIVSDISNPFYSESSKIILEYAKEIGYSVIIYNSGKDNIKESIQNLYDRRVDGVLIASIRRKEMIPKELQERNFPVLFYNQIIDKKKIDYVNIDDEYGATIAVEHLIEFGHNKIAYISGPINRSTYYNRYVGYKNTLAIKGIPVDKNLIYVGDTDINILNKQLDNILEFKPTSIFASSDAIAFDVLSILLNRGLRVPDDISVIGYGDTSFSSHAYVNLTTISQNIVKMSKIALEEIISIIEKKNLPKCINITLKPELIVRGTVIKNNV